MSIQIDNPFAGYAIGADWNWHKSHGYEGGTDYEVGAGFAIKAAADGAVFITDPGLNGVGIQLADGRKIVYLENRSIARGSGTIKRGEVIAYSGRYNASTRQTMWPHIHAIVNGTRVPFEPLVSGSSTAGGGGATPIDPPNPKPEPEPILPGEDMTHATLYHQINQSDSNQAYIAQTQYTLQIISSDYAAALAKSQGMSIGEITVINENDFAAIKNVFNADLAAFKGMLPAAVSGGGGSAPSAAAVAAAVVNAMPKKLNSVPGVLS